MVTRRSSLHLHSTCISIHLCSVYIRLPNPTRMSTWFTGEVLSSTKVRGKTSLHMRKASLTVNHTSLLLINGLTLGHSFTCPTAHVKGSNRISTRAAAAGITSTSEAQRIWSFIVNPNILNSSLLPRLQTAWLLKPDETFSSEANIWESFID